MSSWHLVSNHALGHTPLKGETMLEQLADAMTRPVLCATWQRPFEGVDVIVCCTREYKHEGPHQCCVEWTGV